MGREIEVRNRVKHLIRKLRRIEYFLDTNETSKHFLENINSMLDIAISDCFLDLILEEGKSTKYIPYTTLKRMAGKLRIPKYTILSREELIYTIKEYDPLLGEYIEEVENNERSYKTIKKSEM